MFNTLKQFSTNSKPLIWLTTRERLATHDRHMKFYHLLKEQSHKDLLILRKNAHDMQLIDHNRCRSNILRLRYLV